MLRLCWYIHQNRGFVRKWFICLWTFP